MKKKLLITWLLSMIVILGQAQQAKEIKLEALIERINQPNEKVQIYNFWTTWCGPCIKELPQFEQVLQSGIADITLVSLDYDLDPDIGKVNRFITKKNIKSEVLFLTEQNPNAWIDKIEKKWTGAIPATLIINSNTGKRKFLEGMLNEGELNRIIKKLQ